MTIKPIAHQNLSSINFEFILKKIPYKFTESIYSYLETQDLKNFLSTSKSIQKIDSDLKTWPGNYAKLMNQVFNNTFKGKSIEKISNDMVNFCNNPRCANLDFESGLLMKIATDEALNSFRDNFNKLKRLFDDLVVCQKLSEVSKEKLEKAFMASCNHPYSDMVNLFIQSSRYTDISTDCLNKAFKNQARRLNSTVLLSLINSHRFKEISIDNLNYALFRASNKGYFDVVKTIIESKRANEIDTEYFSEVVKSCYRGIKESKKNKRLPFLRIFIKMIQFNNLSNKDFEEILWEATCSWEKDEVEELLQCDRFHKLSIKNLRYLLNTVTRTDYCLTFLKAIAHQLEEISLEEFVKIYNLIDSNISDDKSDPLESLSILQKSPQFKEMHNK